MSKSKNNLSLIAWLVAIALLALNIFQWYKNNQLSTDLTQKTAEYTDIQNIQNELETDYQAALTSLEEMRGDNAELNELIDQQKVELQTQKEKINGLIWTKKELSKAKEEIDLMNSQVSGYIAQINQLKNDNVALNETNLKLNDENTVLSADLNQAKSDVTRLDSTRIVLTSLKEELTTENSTLAEKVDMAEAIKINSISVEGLKEKGSGALKATNKAKNIKVLRTCILTETNMVTPSGPETFFVRILNPQGETITVDGSGGVLTNKLNGEEIRYTTTGTVDYEQKDTDMCVDYNPNFVLGAGNYQIEIYNKEYMVGKGSFNLK